MFYWQYYVITTDFCVLIFFISIKKTNQHQSVLFFSNRKIKKKRIKISILKISVMQRTLANDLDKTSNFVCYPSLDKSSFLL